MGNVLPEAAGTHFPLINMRRGFATYAATLFSIGIACVAVAISILLNLVQPINCRLKSPISGTAEDIASYRVLSWLAWGTRQWYNPRSAMSARVEGVVAEGRDAIGVCLHPAKALVKMDSGNELAPQQA